MNSHTHKSVDRDTQNRNARTNDEPGRDAIVLAVDETTLGVGADLLRQLDSDWPLLMVAHAGEALRYTHRFDPRVTFVCTGDAHLETSLSIVSELHTRWRRRGQPLIALSKSHDDQIERSVRSAGATYYFALNSGSATDSG